MNKVQHIQPHLREALVNAVVEGQIMPPVELLLPLSYEQQRMWFAENSDHDERFYNLYNALRIRGNLNCDALRKSFIIIMERHAILRSRFIDADGIPRQQVLDCAAIRENGEVAFEIPCRDAVEEDENNVILEVLREEQQRKFKLDSGRLLFARLLRFSSEHYVLIVNMHHIVADGWSIGNFMAELSTIYDAISDYSNLKNYSLPELSAQYVDFALWQEAWLQTDESARQLSYWRTQLADLPPLSLHTSNPRPTQKTYNGATANLQFSHSMVMQLNTIAREQQTTLFSVLLTIFAVTLNRQCGADDIAIGTSVSSRNFPILEPLIGLFLNQIVVRTDLSLNPSLGELVCATGEIVRQGLESKDVPFDQVVQACSVKRDSSRSPLFDVLLTLQNTPEGNGHLPEINIEPIEIDVVSAKFDLSWFFNESADGLEGILVYNCGIFNAELITPLINDFRYVSECLVSQPEMLLSDIEAGVKVLKVDATMPSPAKDREPANATSRPPTERVSKYRRRKRKAVNLADIKPVTEGPMMMPECNGRQNGPYLIQPALDHVNIAEWLEANMSRVREILNKYGSVLLRGFNLSTIEPFERILNVVCSEVIQGYGDLPEEKGSRKVYGSTPYPENKMILYHSESSHLRSWPTTQFFACVQASDTGGETPIVDTRQIYQRLEPDICKRFEEKGLLYVRNFILGLDVRWQDFYKTDDRHVAEQKIKQGGGQHRWMSDGTLFTERCAQAIDTHPLTGEKIFFNQIMLHHPYYLNKTERDALLTLYGEEKRLPRTVQYGDGSDIESDVLGHLLELYEDEAVDFVWQNGDMLICDNMLVAHARRPFTGARKIIVGMGDPISLYRQED